MFFCLDAQHTPSIKAESQTEKSGRCVSPSTSFAAVRRVELCSLSHLNDEQASRLRADGGRLAGLQEGHFRRKVLEHEPVDHPRMDGHGGL